MIGWHIGQLSASEVFLQFLCSKLVLACRLAPCWALADLVVEAPA